MKLNKSIKSEKKKGNARYSSIQQKHEIVASFSDSETYRYIPHAHVWQLYVRHKKNLKFLKEKILFNNI